MLNRNLSDFLDSTKVKRLTEKISRSKKAISPILATLLLIVIAVAAIVVTYAWIMTYMTSATSQAGVLLKKDAVNWPSNTTIIIYVRNTGTADAIMDAVYVGKSSTDLILQTSVSYDPTSKAVLKDGGTITITVGYNWTSQTTYYFRIVPKVGEALVFQEKAP
jgi:flagellin-like protein